MTAEHTLQKIFRDLVLNFTVNLLKKLPSFKIEKRRVWLDAGNVFNTWSAAGGLVEDARLLGMTCGQIKER